MGSYVGLAKGSKNGSVIMAGNAAGSRIMEVLASGDMPRGGEKVSTEELALLSAWIDGGAKFDGPDPAAPLKSFASGPTKKDETAKKLEVVPATGKEAVQFVRDIAPILLAHCEECHGENNPRNAMSFYTFNRLLRGGTSGLALAPGAPEESLLVKKLRGEAGARMPLDRPPLAAEELAKIEKWITLDAHFEGPAADMPLDELVALDSAQRATHEELSRSRAALAAKNWRLMLPDRPPSHEETAQVLVYGHAAAEVLSEIARSADEQAAKIAKLFKLPADRPLIKGRLTLFVFDKRYDYGEVGAMLEHREIPATLRGHWRFTGVDAYGCLLVSDDRVAPGLVAQVMTGAHLASLRKVPRWFAEGSARAVASKFYPKDPRVKLWDDQVGHILAAQEKPTGFLTGDVPAEDADILSFSLAKYLMTQGGRYTSLIAAIEQGAAFDEGFLKSFGASPDQMVAHWAERVAKRGR
jgi:hypothetical protein